MSAAWGWDITVMEMLIAAGAKINKKNSKGETALTKTITSKRIPSSSHYPEAAIQWLIEHGADVNVVDKDGWSLLKKAFWRCDDNTIEFLTNAGAHIGNQDRSALLDDLLMGAAWCWNIYQMEYLCKAGANINAKVDGQSALTKAIVSDYLGAPDSCRVEAVQWLIEHGADVNVVDKDGWSLLKKAAWRVQTDIVKLLIEAGADTDVVDNGGWTSLMVAEHEGHKEIVALLKKAGARK